MITAHSILLAFLAMAAAPQFEVQPLRGQPVTGRLVALDGKQVSLEAAAGRSTWKTSELTGISAKPSPSPPAQQPEAWIDLVDGSTLLARQFTVHEGLAKIVLKDAAAVELPVRAIAVVRFQPATATVGAEWARLLKKKTTGDLLVTVKGDVVDYHQGAVGNVTGKTVDLDLDGEMIPVKRAKVFGLIYRVAEREPSEPLCWITDAGGSRWAVQSMTLASDLTWTTVGGARVSRALDQVSQIDLSRGKIVYLSDLKPESIAYTPYFPLKKELPAEQKFFRLREDQNLESKPLRLGGKQFSKGLALHSRTEAVYYLPGRFRRFEAVAGIDDEVRPRGSVHVIFRGDGKLLWEATLTGADKEPARPIDLDVTGVRRLTIVADFTAELDAAGHLVLGNARVSK